VPALLVAAGEWTAQAAVGGGAAESPRVSDLTGPSILDAARAWGGR
jgi:hypothetical protein